MGEEGPSDIISIKTVKVDFGKGMEQIKEIKTAAKLIENTGYQYNGCVDKKIN